jgi:hypothetical protein
MITVFSDEAPCGLVDGDRRFREAKCLNNQYHPDEVSTGGTSWVHLHCKMKPNIFKPSKSNSLI